MAGGPDDAPSTIVCACRLVSEDELRAQVQAGARTLGELIRRADAGNRCGACLPTLWRLIEADRLGREERSGDTPAGR